MIRLPRDHIFYRKRARKFRPEKRIKRIVGIARPPRKACLETVVCLTCARGGDAISPTGSAPRIIMATSTTTTGLSRCAAIVAVAIISLAGGAVAENATAAAFTGIIHDHDHGHSRDFVRRVGTSLETSKGPYRFVGMNYWYGPNLGSRGPGGDRDRLRSELDELSSRGVKNLRVMAGSEGPNDQPYRIVPAMQTAPGVYDPEVLEGLDFLLDELRSRGMKAVMCLTNEWAWSGGLAQYLVWAGYAKKIPYHPPGRNTWNEFMHFTSHAFGHERTVQLYHDHVRFIVGRTNSVNGVRYTEDPTIMSWELANEPRGMNFFDDFLRWVKDTSALIKAMDPNHLVTIGLEGDTIDPKYNGINFERLNEPETIDYTTIHIWAENW